MYALTVTTKNQLEKAIARARAQKPKFREIEFGVYSVQSTDPKKPDTFYDTGIQPALGGGYDVICTCPTEPRLDKKTGEKQDHICKHVASVFPHYLMREQEEEDKKRASALLCNNCGAEAHVFFLNGERLCWPCLEVRADAEADKDAAQEMLAEAEAEECYSQICPAPGRKVVETVRPRHAVLAETYTDQMAAQDHDDLFGFVPARRERVKEEW